MRSTLLDRVIARVVGGIPPPIMITLLYNVIYQYVCPIGSTVTRGIVIFGCPDTYSPFVPMSGLDEEDEVQNCLKYLKCEISPIAS